MNRFDPADPLEIPYRGKRVMDPLSDELEQRTARLVLVVVLGILLGALCLVVAEAKSQEWVAFLTVGLAGFLFLTRFYEASLVAFLALCWINFGSPAIAQGASGGGEQRLMFSHMGLLALVFVGGVRAIFLARSHQARFSMPLLVPMLAYTGICLWSTLHNILFPNLAVLESGGKLIYQVNLLEILTRILAFGGLLLIGYTLRGTMLKAGAVAIAVPGLLLLVGIGDILPTANEWKAFPQMITAGILGAFALDNSVRKPLRLLCATVVLWLFAIVFLKNTEWVSGWLGMGITLALVTFYGNRKLFMVGAALVVALIILNFPYFYKKIYVDNFYTEHGPMRVDDPLRGKKENAGGLDNDRIRMLRASMRYATVFPLGIGPGNYKAYNEYFGRAEVWNTTTFTSAHGTFAQTLSETGWLGLLTLLWVLIVCGKMLKRYYLALPEGWAKTYTLGAWGAVIGLFVCSFNGDYLFPTYHNGGLRHFGMCAYTWLLIGVVFAIARENNLEWKQLKHNP